MVTLKSVLFCVAVPAIALAQSSGTLDLLSFAPPDAQVLAGAHVDAAKTSAFGVFVLSRIQSSNPGLQRFIADTGVDPRTDVSEVVIAMSGTPGPGAHHGLVAAHGMFSNSIATLEAAAQTNGGTVDHLSGVDLIHLSATKTDNTGTSHNGCIALYTDAATAVIGDCTAVQAALTTAAPKAPTGTALLTKAALYRSQQDLWFTSVLPLGQIAKGAPQNANPLLNSNLIQAIQQTSGGVKFAAASGTQGPTVQVSGEVLMDTAQNASALVNVIDFFKGLIQGAPAANQPGFGGIAALLAALQPVAAGNVVTASLAIPEPALEQLFQALHAQAAPVADLSTQTP